MTFVFNFFDYCKAIKDLFSSHVKTGWRKLIKRQRQGTKRTRNTSRDDKWRYFSKCLEYMISLFNQCHWAFTECQTVVTPTRRMGGWWICLNWEPSKPNLYIFFVDRKTKTIVNFTKDLMIKTTLKSQSEHLTGRKRQNLSNDTHSWRRLGTNNKRSFHVGKYFLSRVATNQEVSLIIPYVLGIHLTAFFLQEWERAIINLLKWECVRL